MSDTRARRVPRPIEDIIGSSPEHQRNYQTAGDVFEGARIIRAMRDLSGLKQEAVASRLNVSQPLISAMEAGRGTEGVTYGTLKRIARACEVDVLVRITAPPSRGYEGDKHVLFEVRLPLAPASEAAAEDVRRAFETLRKYGDVKRVPKHVDVAENPEERLMPREAQ